MTETTQTTCTVAGCIQTNSNRRSVNAKNLTKVLLAQPWYSEPTTWILFTKTILQELKNKKALCVVENTSCNDKLLAVSRPLGWSMTKVHDWSTAREFWESYGIDLWVPVNDMNGGGEREREREREREKEVGA